MVDAYIYADLTKMLFSVEKLSVLIMAFLYILWFRFSEAVVLFQSSAVVLFQS